MIRGEPVGFALVGLGMAGDIHAREFEFVEEARLVAVCGRAESKTRAFAGKYGVKRWYTSYEDLLADGEVEVVNILVPTGLHAELTIAASRAGKHVLVEKPLEINLARADEMIRVCRENGTRLGVIFQMRFGSVARTLKETIESGALGKILVADAIDKESRTAAYYESAAWRGTKELEGGGSLMTQSIHIIDLLQHLAGPVRSVLGRVATRRHRIEVEDTAAAVVCFTSGAMGVIESTTSVAPAMRSRLEIHGERGTIVANAQYDQILFWNVEGRRCELEVVKSIDLGDIDDPWSFPQTRHRIQIQDMARAVREDRDPVLTGEDARVSLAIIAGITNPHEPVEKSSLKSSPRPAPRALRAPWKPNDPISPLARGNPCRSARRDCRARDLSSGEPLPAGQPA